MGATGQDAPPPAGTEQAPGGDQTQQGTPDPWEAAFSQIPDATRQFAEEAFNPLREQFTPRLEIADRLEPLGDYADDLLGLLQDADDEGNSLQDVLGFASMLSQVDPENPEAEGTQAFAEWWESIGEQLGLFAGDDDEDGGYDGDDDGGDPASARIEELEGQLQALRQELGGIQSQGRVQSVQQEIGSALENGLKQHGIEDSEDNRDFILRLSRSYADDPDLNNKQVIEKGLADYLRLTGQGQRELLGDREVEHVAAGRSPGGGRPDVSPDEVTTGDPAQSRKRASQLARQRLAQAG